jgi:hypothetical protein
MYEFPASVEHLRGIENELQAQLQQHDAFEGQTRGVSSEVLVEIGREF